MYTDFDESFTLCCALEPFLDNYSNIQDTPPRRRVSMLCHPAKYIISRYEHATVCQSHTEMMMADNSTKVFDFERLLIAKSLDLKNNRLVCYVENG